MIIRFGYDPTFHYSDNRERTICGEPIDPRLRWKSRRRINSPIMSDDVLEARWGIECGRCSKVKDHWAHMIGMNGPLRNFGKERKSVSIVDIAKAAPFSKAL